MTETVRSFHVRILGTITSGTLLWPIFADVHDAIEHIAGHPVRMHEIPNAIRDICAPAVLAAYPEMPTDTPADCEKCAADLVARYGPALEIAAGKAEHAADPTSYLEALIRNLWRR
ncbi:DUF7736 domain-containing protein [Roseixanthobacter pseudopolyaromaticivorans]|uniref:DUF7736 domain-containing protein n=1 Tax=Roseixanthobacter pseudopolyaromaticivorans TaxID=3119920 RepID=UPI0040407F79